MSYIGNSRSLLIINSNVRDDLIPEEVEGVWKNTFELSQEVPGGFEGNVTVIRQKYILDSVVEGASGEKISISANGSSATLTCNDPAISAALSIIRPQEHRLVISIPNRIGGESVPSSFNNEIFDVDGVVYSGIADENGNYITINFSVDNISENTLVEDIINISYGYNSPWEVLDPESDYEIGGTDEVQNKIITLDLAPTNLDKVYVLHRAEGTYKFSPSPKSVGPEQLSENLRNFVVDRYTSSAGQTVFDLSQPAISAGSLIVSLNGAIIDSTDDGVSIFLGEYLWTLNAEGTQITFNSPPPDSSKVRIVHLGFSTISRRAKFATGQASQVGPGTVGNEQLKNGAVTTLKVADGAITTQKITNNNVTGAKILLGNNESLRAKNTSDGSVGLLKLNAQNKTVIQNDTEIGIEIGGTNKISITSSAIVPETTNTIDLGSSTKKLKDVYVAGNINVDGNVDGANISDLQNQITEILNKINNGDILPIGSIIMWGSNAVPTDRGWLRCDGSSVSRNTYSELFNILGTTFGSGDGTTTFNLPDLRTRVPVGSNSTGNNVGVADGKLVDNRTITHSHTGGSHSHGMSSHTHGVPGHYHTQDTSIGSDFRIAVSSGEHNTKIIFPKTVLMTGTESGGSIVPDGAHGHSSQSPIATTNPDALNNQLALHTHPATASSFDANHSHYLNANSGGYATSSGNSNLTAYSSDNTSFDRRRRTSDPIVEGSNGTAKNLNHSHTITVAASTNGTSHTHSLTPNIVSNSTSNHQHGVVIPARSGLTALEEEAIPTSSRGFHTHAASSFSGSIGKVTGGVSGNDNITTQGPSTPNTESGGVVQTTEDVSPYIVVNFIIKAKQV